MSSGGSSGGEGALIAMRGSVLGVGSDLGGSIRCVYLLLRLVAISTDLFFPLSIPAAFNGLYGFRPSYNRVPYGGSVNSQEGQEG
jgi:amidase